MARLIDLSTELLLDILHRIPSEDLESTSESCRLLRRVTRPLLDKHRKELEKQYMICKPPVIEAGCTEEEACNEDFKGWYTGLLCTIMTDKRIGRLIEELEVTSRTWDLVDKKGGWDPNQKFPGSLPGFMKARRPPWDGNACTMLQLSEQALHRSKLIPQEEKEHWLKGLQHGNQMLAVALLLENLPALSTITIDLDHETNMVEYERLVNWAERAAAESQSRLHLDTPVSLPCQNLKVVHLEFNEARWHSVAHVKAFFALPSISDLSCVGLYMQDDKHQVGDGVLSHPSPLLSLMLHDSSFDLTALSELLQNSPRLEHFTYAYGQEGIFRGKDEWFLRGSSYMIEALGRSAGHCLETLEVFGVAWAVGTVQPDAFNDFKSLKLLEINPIVLHDEENGSKLRGGGVARILPACLQELVLDWGGKAPLRDVQSVREYLVALMQEAKAVLPLLWKISIYGGLSKQDEYTLHVDEDDEVSGWRLFEVDRYEVKGNEDSDDVFATFHFKRTHEEAEDPGWKSQTTYISSDNVL